MRTTAPPFLLALLLSAPFASRGSAAPLSPLAWGASATLSLEAPLGLAARDGFVYVTDFHAGRVWKLTTAGEPVASWNGAPDAALRHPSGIAIDREGNVLVADFGAHAVFKLSSDGTLLARWGSPGSGAGELRGPFGIAVDAAGGVYVTELDNQRVQKFTGDGEPIGAWGAAGSQPGAFSDPMGIAVDASGEILVADHGNHRVQRFASDGRFLGAWGAVDAADSYLLGPVAIAAGNDAVYVTDLANPMAQKFSPEGGFVTQWKDESGLRPLPGSLYGVAVDGKRVFVADLWRQRLASFVDETPSRLPGARRPLAFAIGSAWPNPSAASVTVTFAVPARARLRADVFDVNGRHVRRLNDAPLDPGEHRITWDGRDADGAAAAPGVYFVRGLLDGVNGAVRTRVAVIR